LKEVVAAIVDKNIDSNPCARMNFNCSLNSACS